MQAVHRQLAVGQSGLAPEQAFLDLLSAEYDAGLELVDYATDPEAARAAINEWVAQQTNDRIPELLVEGTITPDARLTLVNAIYLEGQLGHHLRRGADHRPAVRNAGGRGERR